ncbi:MAG: hypothetical protein AAF492_27860 [Verrucomicrobiota bacterium]
MLTARRFLIPAVAGLLTVCSQAYAEDQKTIFKDDFNRADADSAGDGWTTRGDAVVKDKAAFFKLMDAEFRPRMKHSFPVQKEGTFTVSFLMDWLRDNEGTWGFFMQLGNSEAMPKSLVYDKDLAKGIGVNLVWGGGDLVDYQDAGSFGYYKGGKFTSLFVANDVQSGDSVVKKPVVTIEVNVDAGTYSLSFNGKTYPNLPFDNKGPIDTVRFTTHLCSVTGFTKTSIDDLVISQEK